MTGELNETVENETVQTDSNLDGTAQDEIVPDETVQDEIVPDETESNETVPGEVAPDDGAQVEPESVPPDCAKSDEPTEPLIDAEAPLPQTDDVIEEMENRLPVGEMTEDNLGELTVICMSSIMQQNLIPEFAIREGCTIVRLSISP